MRLNNKELKVVVDEIYKRVSQPTVDANEKIASSVSIKDEFTDDCNTIDEIDAKIRELNSTKNDIANKWKGKTVNGFIMDSYSPMARKSDYVRFMKALDPRLAKYPTKEEIESQIIIAGYSEIPELIAQITAMYQ